MGEVYRARDTRLDRDVAIKVLPGSVSGDSERTARFRREAKLLAALNHPNIAAVYGFEDNALVMELVPGETLQQRLARGQLPLADAVAIASQLIDAIDAAHEQGIVHRDLKPANIKLREDGAVKVLDFGLAKALDPDASSSAEPANSPTITSPAMTHVGLILGTAAYMSPEQARGKTVDKRADVWAFGCVLFELLTGRMAFGGDTLTDTLAAIVTREPDWTLLPPATPDTVSGLLRRCLDKDPRRRLRDIADARHDLSSTAVSSAHAPRAAGGWMGALPWATTAVLAVATLLLIGARGYGVGSSAAPARPTWLTMLPPPDQPLYVSGLQSSAVLTPDGSRIIYVSREGLAVRSLEAGSTVLLNGTEEGRAPFLSHDARNIGFYRDDLVLTVPVDGGPTRIVGHGLSGGMRGAFFEADGSVVAAFGGVPGIMRLRPGGDAPEPVTQPDVEHQEVRHSWPNPLPGGRGLLLTVVRRTASQQQFEVAVFDAKTRRHRVLASGTQAKYINGSVLFAAGGRLMAAPFDLERLEFVAEPAPVLDGVPTLPTGAAEYDVSASGSLIYIPNAGSTSRSLVWVDRAGRQTLIPAPPLPYFYPRLSPDGTRIALDVRVNLQNSIQIYDLRRDVLTLLTVGAASGLYPVWSRDGERLYFGTLDGKPGLVVQRSDGTGAVQRLSGESASLTSPYALTPDGARLVGLINSNLDIGIVELRPALRVATLVGTSNRELNADVSPNGRFLAYQSDETGRWEIYVRPFPDTTAGIWQVSKGGGTRPAFARDGKELFFLDPTGAMMRVPVSLQGTFSAGTPDKLFEGVSALAGYAFGRNYDVAPDGRFVMVKDSFVDSDGNPAAITVVLDWLQGISRR
jgi:serine/threonine-protein kinase